MRSARLWSLWGSGLWDVRRRGAFTLHTLYIYTLHIHFTYTLYIHFTYTLHTLYVLEDLVAVLLEDGLKELLLLLRVRATVARALLDPRLEERAPLGTFIRRDVEDTHAAHGGRSRVPAFCGEWGQD